MMQVSPQYHDDCTPINGWSHHSTTRVHLNFENCRSGMNESTTSTNVSGGSRCMSTSTSIIVYPYSEYIVL